MLNATGAVRNQIRENKTYQIGSIIQTGSKQGMQTLDQSLAKLTLAGLVAKEDALTKAKDPGEYLRLIATGGGIPSQPTVQEGATPPSGGLRRQPNRPGYNRGT